MRVKCDGVWGLYISERSDPLPVRCGAVRCGIGCWCLSGLSAVCPFVFFISPFFDYPILLDIPEAASCNAWHGRRKLHDIPHTHTHTRGASKEQGGSKIPLVLFVGCQLSRGGKVGWLVSGKKEEAELPLTAVSCCCVATAACSTALFPLSLSLCPSVY
jgi:hypothetical protein